MDNTIGFLIADWRRSVVTGIIFFLMLLIVAVGDASGADIFSAENLTTVAKLTPFLFVIAQAMCIGGRLVLWYVYLRFERRLTASETACTFSAQDYDYFARELSRAVRRGRG